MRPCLPSQPSQFCPQIVQAHMPNLHPKRTHTHTYTQTRLCHIHTLGYINVTTYSIRSIAAIWKIAFLSTPINHYETPLRPRASSSSVAPPLISKHVAPMSKWKNTKKAARQMYIKHTESARKMELKESDFKSHFYVKIMIVIIIIMVTHVSYTHGLLSHALFCSYTHRCLVFDTQNCMYTQFIEYNIIYDEYITYRTICVCLFVFVWFMCKRIGKGNGIIQCRRTHMLMNTRVVLSSPFHLFLLHIPIN